MPRRKARRLMFSQRNNPYCDLLSKQIYKINSKCQIYSITTCFTALWNQLKLCKYDGLVLEQSLF